MERQLFKSAGDSSFFRSRDNSSGEVTPRQQIIELVVDANRFAATKRQYDRKMGVEKINSFRWVVDQMMIKQFLSRLRALIFSKIAKIFCTNLLQSNNAVGFFLLESR